MSDEILFNELKAQTAILTTISRQLETLAQANAQQSPGYRRRLSEYQGFDWQSIGAVVVAQDAHGVAEVEWAGHRFTRTSGEKYNDEFCIFSRPAPDWSQDNKRYFTLIRFADYSKTPLSTPPPSPNSQSSIPNPTPPAENKRFQERLKRQQQRQQQLATIIPEGMTPRQAFYDIGSKAISAGRIAVNDFNELVNKANTEDWGAALQGLTACLA